MTLISATNQSTYISFFLHVSEMSSDDTEYCGAILDQNNNNVKTTTTPQPKKQSRKSSLLLRPFCTEVNVTEVKRSRSPSLDSDWTVSSLSSCSLPSLSSVTSEDTSLWDSATESSLDSWGSTTLSDDDLDSLESISIFTEDSDSEITDVESILSLDSHCSSSMGEIESVTSLDWCELESICSTDIETQDDRKELEQKDTVSLMPWNEVHVSVTSVDKWGNLETEIWWMCNISSNCDIFLNHDNLMWYELCVIFYELWNHLQIE